MSGGAWFRFPDRQSLWTILGWSLLIDLLFFPIYLEINAYTSQRGDLLDLYLPAELAIPLVPEAIFIYLSMFLLFCLPLFALPCERAAREAIAAILGLFISATIWLLLPARLGFDRIQPTGYESIYGLIFILDEPHNLVPSLHIVFSTIAVQACAQDAPPRIKVGLWAWLICIAVSTLLTHQHHILDVGVGFLVAFVCRAIALRLSIRQGLSFMLFFAKESEG